MITCTRCDHASFATEPMAMAHLCFTIFIGNKTRTLDLALVSLIPMVTLTSSFQFVANTSAIELNKVTINPFPRTLPTAIFTKEAWFAPAQRGFVTCVPIAAFILSFVLFIKFANRSIKANWFTFR